MLKTNLLKISLIETNIIIDKWKCQRNSVWAKLNKNITFYINSKTYYSATESDTTMIGAFTSFNSGTWTPVGAPNYSENRKKISFKGTVDVISSDS